MKLLMLNLFFHPYKGGTEKHLLEVTKRLAKRHEVTVLTARLKGTLPEEYINGVRVVRTPARIIYDLPPPLPPPIPLMPRHARDMEKLLKEHDIVHGHNRFMYGLRELRLVEKLGKKMCWTLHNATPSGIDFLTDSCGQLFDTVIGNRILNRCDGILGVSRDTLDVTLPKCFSGIRMVAYNGVDSDVFRPISGKAMRERFGLEGSVVMTNCRLVEQKGVKYLIEAMRGMDAHLFVLGRGPQLGKLKATAKKNTVFVTEWFGEEELAALYCAADIFVLPSLWEPFGMVLTEAMACGRPVIGTTAGGIPEIIAKDCGFIVPPASPAALREKISTLLDDSSLRKKFGASARKRAESFFTWDNTVNVYDKLYSQL
jgi:glycosyltransferase involved in cell wall biosynthesis